MTTMQETQVQSLGQENPLEKEMATHSSILAWKIAWLEEPCGLQSMEPQRVGHNWATNSLSSCTSRLPRWLSGKELPASARDVGNVDSIPGSGRFPWVGNVNPLQYYCLENFMNRGAWQATVHGVSRSSTRLSMCFFMLCPSRLSAF